MKNGIFILHPSVFHVPMGRSNRDRELEIRENFLGAAKNARHNGRTSRSQGSPAMVDLFNLLKEFLRAESEVIAAFAMGILVALIFLFTFLFWLFNRWYGGKISNLESDLKEAKTALDEWKLQGQDAKKDLAEAKRKSKERKSKLDEQAKEIQQLTAKLDAESLARANDEDATQGLQEKLKT